MTLTGHLNGYDLAELETLFSELDRLVEEHDAGDDYDPEEIVRWLLTEWHPRAKGYTYRPYAPDTAEDHRNNAADLANDGKRDDQ